jgi:uncharacterized protein YdhG (YjbR/CyaY superfamily)
MQKGEYKTVDEYIALFPQEIQSILNQIRQIVKTHAPEAEESINYMMPAYKTHGKPLVYFAAMKNHIGFYATPTGNEAFKKELANYVVGKGSIQFPLNQPMPFDLMAEMVKFNVITNAENAKLKKKK